MGTKQIMTPSIKKAVQLECYSLKADGWTVRDIGVHLGISFGAVSRIIRQEPGVSDNVYRIAARNLEVIAPPYRAYRPCIQPVALRDVASGREIAELLEEMNNAQVNMDYVLEALSEKLLDDIASGPVTVTPYSVYGFNEMEGI